MVLLAATASGTSPGLADFHLPLHILSQPAEELWRAVCERGEQAALDQLWAMVDEEEATARGAMGDLAAGYYLANIYREGSGCLRQGNDPQANGLLYWSAVGGYPPAQASWGVIAFLGDYGAIRSEEEGLSFLRAATQAGVANAAISIVSIHARGMGAQPRDLALAQQWYDTARAAGVDDADALERMQAEITEGRALAVTPDSFTVTDPASVSNGTTPRPTAAQQLSYDRYLDP